jgi:radical SAM superfamily enzyme
VAAQLNKLINFVSNAVDTEKSNEIAYFQNKINTFKHTEGLKDEEVIKELQQYLTPDTFQYDKVITLINVLL